jgi:hypothetical protein
VNPPDRAIRAAAATASDLRERVTQALKGPGRATLAIHEEELTVLLRQALSGSPARAVTLHITDEAVYLQMAIGRWRTPVRATLIPTTSDGRLTARVSCLTVADRPLPRVVGAAIESAVSALATDAAWSLHVESVTLGEGKLVLVAERR